MKLSVFLLRLSLAAVMASSVLLSSCASIIHGSTQTIHVTSQPVGAAITVDEKPSGTTPADLKVSRKTSHLVELTLAGYKRYEVTLEPKFNSATMGNILAGGIIGMGIDHSTGANNTLYPDHVDAMLQKK